MPILLWRTQVQNLQFIYLVHEHQVLRKSEIPILNSEFYCKNHRYFTSSKPPAPGRPAADKCTPEASLTPTGSAPV